MTSTSQPLSGMRAFIVIWLGQIVSLLGTAMTTFGISIWAFEGSGRATDLTLIFFFFILAYQIVTPFAGVAVDKFNRKLMMILSDLAAGVVTIGLIILFATERLEMWHIYVASAIQGGFNAFQWPAFSTAITMILPKEHYTRADSMMNLANAGANTFAGMLAATIMGWLGTVRGLQFILLFDCISFVVAVTTVLAIQVPSPTTSADGEAAEGTLWQQIVFGFRYILERPSLLGLQLVFFFGNFFSSIAFVLQIPMILLRTGSNELLVGTIQAIGSAGGVLGGIAISAWGGFKRRVHGVLLGWIFCGGLFTILFGLGRGEPAWAGLPIWGGSLLLAGLINPLINSSNQGIWQSKVPPDVQGRVFSARGLIAWAAIPLANLVAGPLADYVMEPAMLEGGSLAETFGWLTGTGPGAGMSLLFIVAGIVIVIIGFGGYLFSAIRDAEDLLPDHDMVGEATGQAPA